MVKRGLCWTICSPLLNLLQRWRKISSHCEFPILPRGAARSGFDLQEKLCNKYPIHRWDNSAYCRQLSWRLIWGRGAYCYFQIWRDKLSDNIWLLTWNTLRYHSGPPWNVLPQCVTKCDHWIAQWGRVEHRVWGQIHQISCDRCGTEATTMRVTQKSWTKWG